MMKGGEGGGEEGTRKRRRSSSAQVLRKWDHFEMKRAAPWEQSATSSDDSSDSDSEDVKLVSTKLSTKSGGSCSSRSSTSEVDPRKKRQGGMDYESLSRHGYSGGPSILKVPPPVEAREQDWSWSTGKQSDADPEEPFEERERTRAAALLDEKLLMNSQIGRKEKAVSFSQKEKRKREIGQASRGKNYVEEEKRLLRDNGIYSGFDS